MPKNRAENIHGIFRYLSNKKPIPREKAKVRLIRRKTNSTTIHLRLLCFACNIVADELSLLPFIVPFNYIHESGVVALISFR